MFWVSIPVKIEIVGNSIVVASVKFVPNDIEDSAVLLSNAPWPAVVKDGKLTSDKPDDAKA